MAKKESSIYDRVSVGRPRSFKDQDDLWNQAKDYFKWCELNTLQESKVFNNQGVIIEATVPHMRAMTQSGLCTYLNIGVSTWHDYKDKEEFSEVTQMIEQIMYEQKFTGAAAGMLNANIVARDLGLAEKSESKTLLSVVDTGENEW